MRTPIAGFLIVVFALAAALGLLVGATGGADGRFAALGILSMFFPAVAVAVLNVSGSEPPRVDWRRLPLAYVPVALLLMPLALHAAMLAPTLAVNGHLPWQPWLTPAADGLYHTPSSRGWGVLTATWLAMRIAINAVAGVLIVSALAFFEEIGWRGWLLPRLRDRMNARLAVVVTSTIWAVWHVPFALSGIQHVDGVSAARLALLVPLGTAAAGLIIGWLWLRTESIWIVALAHGALNNWGQYGFKFMQDFTDPSPTMLLLAGSLALLVVGCTLLVLAWPEDKADARGITSAGPSRN